SRSLAAIVLGILQLQLTRYRFHVGQRHLDRDAVFEPSDSEKAVAASPEGAVIVGVKRRPELGITVERELEILGQYADNGVRSAAERNGLSNRFFPSTKPFLPRGKAQNHSLRRRRQILAGIKIAPQHRRDAQSAK